jgi:hypothetical protein
MSPRHKVRGDLHFSLMPLSQLLPFVSTPEQERLVWLAGSVLLYVLGTNAAWAFRRVVTRWPAARLILAGLVRFVFFVGVPYTALLGGVITLKSLGLAQAPQRESLNQGVPLALGAVFLMGLIGWYYRREVTSLGEETAPSLQATRQMLGRPWGWVLLLIGVAYQQIHWAFYRALPFLILDDLYAGAFLGLALVLLEAYADPRVRHDLADPAGAEWLVLSAGFAVVTTVLFVLTGTSWLGAGIHFTTAIGWVLLIRARQSLRPRESQSVSEERPQ